MTTDLPQSFSELTIEDTDLLIEAMRIAARDPRYMNDPNTSLRLGWIVGMLRMETERRIMERNEQ